MASGMSTVGAGDDYPDPDHHYDRAADHDDHPDHAADQTDNHADHAADHDEEIGGAGSGMACLLWERGTREATDRSDLTPCLHRPDHDDDDQDDDDDDQDDDHDDQD